MGARQGLEGRRSRCGSNGAGRDPRNPGKPVENGLFVDFRDKMNGGACEITVQKEKFGVEIAVFLLFCR